MLNIKLICVGKLNEDYLKEAQKEYIKRLSKYCKLDIIEIPSQKLIQNNLSKKDEENIINLECEKILEKINKLGKCVTIALDLEGASYSSIQLSEKIDKISTYESSTIVFIIGGTLGLTRQLVSSCNYSMCFSKLTFSHQLIRIFLLEQLFRSFKILNNEVYHH